MQTEKQALALVERILATGTTDPAQALRDAGVDPAVNPGVWRRASALLDGLGDEQNLLTGSACLANDEPDQSGETAGDYVLGALLGRGGMGAVYRAERQAGDFDHRVAIKLIRPALVTPDMVARFHAERQTLAAIRHPNIAQLFGGGTTKGGAPFLVMEFVEGPPLGQWLDRYDPDLDRRLDLFAQVCAGIACAHANLVVHRDITPANILVEKDGTAKIIDFGIAKPVAGPDAAPDTAPGAPQNAPQNAVPDAASADRPDTRDSGPSLSATPGYSAPERRFGAAPTTLSDIYSLGHLLQTMAGPRAPRELAAVAAKASAARPGDRYATVDALSDDVRRFREGRPVNAYPGTRLDRALKFVRRHTVPVALGSAVALSLVAGLLSTSVLYKRAEEQRQQAEARFDDTRALANYVIFDAFDNLDINPGTLSGLGDMSEKAQGYLETLRAGSGGDTGLALEVARGYHRLGAISGSPTRPNLGQAERAETLLARAETEFRALLRQTPDDPDVLRAAGDFWLEKTAFAFIHFDSSPLTLQAADEGLELADRLAAVSAETTEDQARRVQFVLARARALAWSNEAPAALAAFRNTEALLNRLELENADPAMLREQRARVYGTAGDDLSMLLGDDAIDPDALLEFLQKAAAIRRAMFAEAPDDLALQSNLGIALYRLANHQADTGQLGDSLVNINAALMHMGNYAAALPDDEKADRLINTTLSRQKAQTLWMMGRTAESIRLYEAVIAYLEAKVAQAPGEAFLLRELGASYDSAAPAYATHGRIDTACQYFRKAQDMFARMLDGVPRSGTLGAYMDGVDERLAECAAGTYTAP